MTTGRLFVGRERELEQLRACLEGALANQGQVVFVNGEVGSGKTALVTEFARRAQEKHSGLLVTLGTCNALSEGIGDPCLPFREVLGMLTGGLTGKLSNENASRLQTALNVVFGAVVEFAPDLVGGLLPGAGLVTRVAKLVADKVGWLDKLETLVESDLPEAGDLEQDRLFEQYTSLLQKIAAKHPLIVILDDLQWVDTTSTALLFHLSRQIGGDRVLIIGTYRPEEVDLGREGKPHPLQKVVNECKRHHEAVVIELDRANALDGAQFVDALVDAYVGVDPEELEGFRQALYQHTDGHPLFTVELLKDLERQGLLTRDSMAEGIRIDWEALPARVDGVIKERVGRLEEELLEALRIASVEGKEFTVQVLTHIKGVGEDVWWEWARELEERHRLIEDLDEVRVDERPLSRYQFEHALLQLSIYGDLPAGRRRLLHGQVAAELEELYSGHEEEILAQLAHHYVLAEQEERAVEYLLQAGDQARRLHAYQEAIDYYERALDILERQRDYGAAARTYMKLGLTHHIAFDFESARRAYEEGFDLWQLVGEAPADESLPPAPQALRVDWLYLPLSLDPARAVDIDSTGVIEQLFSGLVELGPGLEVVPDVAQKWEVHQDGQQYVFRLRDDVRWSDGASVTAGDFEYAWKRVLDPASDSPNASLLYDVKGARAFHQGEIADAGQVRVQAIDDLTLVVELEQPTSYFLHLLTYTASFPVPRHIVEESGDSWADAQAIVTNGPFRVEDWSHDDLLVLARSLEYHRQFTGNVQRVELRALPDGAARLAAYQGDDLDVLFLWDIPKVERVRWRYAEDYVSFPLLATTYVGFDTTCPPFDDVRVRQAFALASGRERLADKVWQGHVFPATGGFVPPGMPGHSEEIGHPSDPGRARQLLVEAGYAGGQGFPAVELLTDRGSEPQCDPLASQWQETLGVEVTWKTVEWEAFLDRVENAPPHIFLGIWVADYPDPDNFLRVCEAIGWTGWQNKVYDRLVEDARLATDQRERMGLYHEADRVLMEEAAIVPLIYRRAHRLVKPWITRFPMTAAKWWFWKDVVIEPHS
jgi:ABC-type oligopeptide transport system substrate-binding subunit/ABC-type transporter Mla MlaB component